MKESVKGLVELVQGVIPTLFTEKKPTENELIDTAKDLRNIYSKKTPISDKEFERAIAILRENIEIEIGIPHSLRQEDTTHQSWYLVHKNDGFYWNRFRKYLETKKHWSLDVVKQLHETTDTIMDDLGNPNAEICFSRRGLLLGDVQSGKTSTYTAICNKAADAGYRVIIVLAGITENLRRQTQERLDAEFAGRESKNSLETNAKAEIKNKFVGVGKIPPQNRDKRISCFTSAFLDFNKVIVNSNDLSLRNLKGTALFVVKKNTSILKNLSNWLKDNNADENGKIDLPLLLIDDEADNASINTHKPENDPTVVNLEIRKILDTFRRSSYLGITATPFANIFINPESEDGKPDDLFPRDFITVLPFPSNYIGAEKIFGLGNPDNFQNRSGGEHSNVLVSIENDEMKDYFTFGHKLDIIGRLNDLPKSLESAIYYFILVTAVRNRRGDETEHCSMLINVSHYTNVQNKIRDLAEDWISDIKSEIESYAHLEPSQALECEHLKCLKDVWDTYDLEAKAGYDWQFMQQKLLYDAVKRIEVRAVNQSTGAESLDYHRYKNIGMRVIAVGGNSLSRGLTLEGLCVSYFYRSTMMYDTLLQMGRWFGYRPNYADLVKIWMAEDVADWYGFVTDASYELKNELREMEMQHKTPKDFGLCVRQDPNSLIVTARNKMRTGTKISVPITLSGRLVETPRLKSDREILRKNEIACKRLIDQLDEMPGVERGEQKSPSAVIWYNVPSKDVVELIDSFQAHPWHLNYQSKALAKYIRDNNDILNTWDIAIPNGEAEEYVLSSNSLKIRTEKRKVQVSGDMIRISGTHVKVGSGNSTRIGLTQTQIEEIDKNLAHGEKKTDRTYLKTERKPILMIHILKAEPENNADCPEYLFALGLGFPKKGDKERTVNYVVNKQKFKEMIEMQEEDGYDDI